MYKTLSSVAACLSTAAASSKIGTRAAYSRHPCNRIKEDVRVTNRDTGQYFLSPIALIVAHGNRFLNSTGHFKTKALIFKSAFISSCSCWRKHVFGWLLPWKAVIGASNEPALWILQTSDGLGRHVVFVRFFLAT